jgi:probable rRNA maturation factor
LSVSVSNRQRRLRVSGARLGRVAGSALSSLGRKGHDLHVAVVGDREIRQLHERYLGRPCTTDVLAFNLQGPGPSRLLGEVIISADTALRQASRVGVTLALELDLLLVHGLLHLVGYDDHTPGKARLMHERERQILSQIRHRVPPTRLFTGLLDSTTGAPGATRAPRMRLVRRTRRRPGRVTGSRDHRP